MSVLISIAPPAFDVEVDIAYATERNFTGRPMYDSAHCGLRPEAAECLRKAIALAKPLGYRLKIFDAFRPLAAQWALWHHTPDPQFVSHPETGSIPHCRGVAVDVTLIDAAGLPLDMGTEFDAFVPRSFHGNDEISREAFTNRLTLLGIMTLAGWDFYRNEWWHYQLFDARRYGVVEG